MDVPSSNEVLDEFSIFYSDDETNLFGDHCFAFDLPCLLEYSTGKSTPGVLEEFRPEESLSWELDDQSTWNNVFPSESSSEGGYVVVPPRSRPFSSAIPLTSSSVSNRATTISTFSSENQDETIRPSISNKRKWENSIVIFSSDPDSTSKLRCRKRKVFGEGRRKEVAMNRIIGACVQCKLRKGSCNFGIPCNQCIKRAGSVTLGQELCARQSLVTVRFNNVDFLRIAHYEEAFEAQPHTPIPGTKRESYIFWPSCCRDSSYDSLIKVQIENFEETIPNETQMIFTRGYLDCGTFHVPDLSTAIAQDSLPSLDLLADCCLTSSHCCNSGPFVGLHKAFSEFGDIYCEGRRQLPLQSLVGKTLRMKRLLSLYRRAAFMKSTPGDPESPFVSSWMKVQLRHHIGKGIMDLEADIFEELDRLLYGPEGIGRRNPLATWVCLWILVLSYKEHMAFIYFHYSQDRIQLQLLYGLAKHIYNTLTSIYAALYQTTSPLTFDWRTKEISQMLGQDPELIKAFCNVKTETYWFHGSKDQLLNEDNLFKKLVVENESKLLAAHTKAAKRSGIL